jgi:type 1 glutamine amidotransferase
VPEQSGHPPLGPTEVVRVDDPRTGPGGSFALVDERYSNLALADDLDVVVEHEHEGRTHPLVWTRTVGGARIVADALGHGPESFDSAGHRDVVLRLTEWALTP